MPLVNFRVKREDRQRAEQLLELAGIKVYRPRGWMPLVGTNAILRVCGALGHQIDGKCPNCGQEKLPSL
jgi:hypothetical protein